MRHKTMAAAVLTAGVLLVNPSIASALTPDGTMYATSSGDFRDTSTTGQSVTDGGVQQTTASDGTPTPEPLASASTTYSQQFVAAAQADGVSSANITQMLNSGDWVYYPTSTSTSSTSAQSVPTSTPEPGDGVTSGPAPDPTSPTDPQPGTLATSSKYCAPNVNGPQLVSGANSASTTAGILICPTGTVAKSTPCAYDVYQVWKKNVFGNIEYKFTLGEHYCYDPSRKVVTSYDGTPYIDHWIASWASIAGFSWVGLDSTGTYGPQYYTYYGVSHGGVKTWRKGEIKYCPVHTPFCVQFFPWIHMYQHGDGTIYVSGHGK